MIRRELLLALLLQALSAVLFFGPRPVFDMVSEVGFGFGM